MSARPLPRSRLDNLIPPLVDGHALVALVPATGDLKWATAAAWDVARAAARHGRRVALVDLWIEDPTLHEVVGLTPSEGIVDAFEYGVSLTKAAHEVDHVFFIAAGAYTAHPGDVFGHERWKKLHGGFRVEGALLLLYLSAGALARLSAVPDGLIVLSPDGFEPESWIGQGISAALERGIPLVGVVRERWTPEPEVHAATPPVSRPARLARAEGRAASRRARPAVVAATLMGGAAVGWVLFANGGDSIRASGAEHRAASPAPPHPPLRARPTPVPEPRLDTLPWTVQLAAYARADKALALADRLASREHLPAFVTPVALEGQTMRLTRLELSGFKSFAGTVALPFEAGVTAIVGPNGCGKSNISDAVRWVLGEQSPRLLRGGKMEDVIFQGSTGRRPVNVAEVSLVFDNSDGTLPLAYQEVVVTRRLSRAGQSEYLLNRSSVRLRDIQDLLRGTGLGADAAVVMEARMIEALLSERAEERRALFEEAAGIGLYRNRKESTERRLEETAADLARLEDLVGEVQTQVRSLARQRGKAERYGKMIEERFGIALTLVRRELEDIDLALGDLGKRAERLTAELPGERGRLGAAEHEREARVQARHMAEAQRTEVERRLADAKLEVGRLEGDLALAAERLRNAAQRRATAGQRRGLEDARAAQAEREQAAAAAECEAAERDLASVGQELAGRTALEQEVRDRLLAQRTAVRELEEDLQRRAEGFRALEGERAALERERVELGQQLAQASGERAARAEAEWAATAQASGRAQEAQVQARAATQAAEELERARRRVAERKEQETHDRAAQRQAEEAVAQVTARRDALAELERERVGLAPAAPALLQDKAQFGDAVLGPLSDFVRTSRRDAQLAEQLLGEWLHAVLVRDEDGVTAIRRRPEQAQPGPLVLLPCTPGPRRTADGHPLTDELRVD